MTTNPVARARIDGNIKEEAASFRCREQQNRMGDYLKKNPVCTCNILKGSIDCARFEFPRISPFFSNNAAPLVAV